jgi:hypothetical protein
MHTEQISAMEVTLESSGEGASLLGLGSGVHVLCYLRYVVAGNCTLAAINVPRVRQNSDGGTDTYRLMA